jgi:2-oxoglutarate ferredoxin oxidoreductase subunit beta
MEPCSTGMLRSIEKMGLSKNEIVVVSGIGCSPHVAGYVDFPHAFTPRTAGPWPFATGVKLGRPDLTR